MGSDEKKPSVVSEPSGDIIVQLGRGGEGESPATAAPPVSAVLPVRDTVIFPGMPMPLAVGREKSLRLLDDLLPKQKTFVAICQKRPEVEDPKSSDLFTIGTAVVVLKMLRMEDGTKNVILRGVERVHIDEWVQQEPYLRARVTPLEEHVSDTTETEALIVNVQTMPGR